MWQVLREKHSQQVYSACLSERSDVCAGLTGFIKTVGFALLPAGVGQRFDYGQEVGSPLIALVVMPFQQSLSNLHPHTVVQLVSCLLMVQHHVYTNTELHH